MSIGWGPLVKAALWHLVGGLLVKAAPLGWVESLVKAAWHLGGLLVKAALLAWVGGSLVKATR